MPNTVYVHVGTEKTGSTFLQSLIEKNEAVFAKNNLYWVKSGLESGHHYWIAKSLGFKYNPGFINENAEKRAIENLVNEISGCNGNTDLLLSSEHFDFNLNAVNSFNLVNFFKGWKVVVLLFVRNQVDYCQSLYIEHLKWGGVENLESFIDQTLRQDRYNYLRRYDTWCEAGAEVRVVDYDNNVKNITGAFLKELDCYKLFEHIGVPSEKSNLSPSIDFMEFVRLVNFGIPVEKRRSFYEQALSFYSNEELFFEKRMFSMPAIFEKVVRQENINNKELAKKLELNHDFLGGSLEDKLICRNRFAPPDLGLVIEKALGFTYEALPQSPSYEPEPPICNWMAAFWY